MLYPRFVRRLPLLLLVALLAGACGVREDGSRAQPLDATAPVDAPDPSPDIAVPAPSPAAPASQNAQQAPPPPLCTLSPGDPVPALAPSQPLDTLVFSEPRVVFAGNRVHIAAWLPDSRRVLLSRVVDRHQSIDILDLATTQSTQVATHDGDNTWPQWLASLDAVAFVEDIYGRPATLKLVRGASRQPAVDIPDVLTPYLALAPQGDQLLYLTSAGLVRASLTRRPDGDSLTAAQETLLARPELLDGFTRVVWSADGRRALLFSENGVKDGVFVLDLSSRQLCTFEWERNIVSGEREWVMDAKWSPNGRYLALIMALGRLGHVQYESLRMLDLATGKLTPIPIPNEHVYELDWLPTGTQLLALGKMKPVNENEGASFGLYVVDVETHNALHVLPTSVFSFGSYYFGGGGGGLAVSPDGSKVLTLCLDRARIVGSNGNGDNVMCVIDIARK